MSIPSSIKSFDQTSIYYEIDPSSRKKEYLVFLHGLSSDLTCWRKERDGLRKLGYLTLAIDLRGHGLSGHPKEEKSYTMMSFVNDVLLVIKKEKLVKPVLIGHCLGGMIALSLEAINPHTSKALILVDTSYKPPYFGTRLAHNILLKRFISLLAKHVPNIGTPGHGQYQKFIGTWDYNPRRVLADILHTSLQSFLYALESFLGFDATTLLKRVGVPTLVIEGTDDIIFPPKVAEDLASRIRTSELDFIPNANHILVLNNPDDLVKTIIRFLQKINF